MACGRRTINRHFGLQTKSCYELSLAKKEYLGYFADTQLYLPENLKTILAQMALFKLPIGTIAGWVGTG